jgi:hypothetical protein
MPNKTTANPKTARNPQHESEENDPLQHKGSSQQHGQHQQKTHDPLKDRRPNESKNQQDEPTDHRKAS